MATKNEEKCKEIFNAYVVDINQGEKIMWKDQSEFNNDPPDFYLYIGDNKYAVEITETKINNKAILDNSNVLQKTYIASHERLIKKIRSRAKKQGLLNGTFIIEFFAPLSSTAFNKNAFKLQEHVINYILKTKDELSYIREGIKINNKRVCYIEKHSSENELLEAVFTGNAAWAHSLENVAIVTNMVQYAVNEKKYKLEKRGIVAPKILIIYDSYHLADEKTYSMSLESKNIANLDYYHSVFIVIEGQCLPFYQNKESTVFTDINHSNL